MRLIQTAELLSVTYKQKKLVPYQLSRTKTVVAVRRLEYCSLLPKSKACARQASVILVNAMVKVNLQRCDPGEKDEFHKI